MTSRIEPFCSQFFVYALNSSIREGTTFFEQAWNLCAPPDWKPPTQAHIEAEEVLDGDKRIDIAIFDETLSRVLGIEVKTTEASVEPGQLETYYRLLQDKYPNLDVCIAFLTPFNECSVKEIRTDSSEALRLPSVREYDELSSFIPQDRSIHVSWRQIVKKVDWAGEPLWEQFTWFVLNKIASLEKLERYLRTDLSLARFFSEEAVEKFGDALQGLTSSHDSVNLETLATKPSALQSFLDALTALIEDDQSVDRRKSRPNKYSPDRIEELVNSDYGRVHSEIFKLSSEYCHVWIEGKSDYGLRVVHYNHPSSGVSILRSITKDNLFQFKSK